MMDWLTKLNGLLSNYELITVILLFFILLTLLDIRRSIVNLDWLARKLHKHDYEDLGKGE